jgi:2-oxoisovalerate dehydrogenase E2 component (dihydrolipoyl transacylase)
MKLPDVGEGGAEAELVEWYVAIGDEVTPETVVAEVLTDKATVEVSSPVAGVVVGLHGEPGDVLAVGGDLIDFDTGGEEAAGEPSVVAAAALPQEPQAVDAPERTVDRSRPRVAAAPAVRARARSLGIELADVHGNGPDGRVVHADLDRLLVSGAGRGGVATGGRVPRSVKSDEGIARPVRGVRRRIAARLTDAWHEIPHITYVESIDATELERLRSELNRESEARRVRLTILPFLATAMAIASAEQPRLNAHYDHQGEMLTTFEAVHVGIATQTDDGLLVPVVRHVEARDIWDIAAELSRVTDAARDGSASRQELSGSTITITSLGALGGVATTPILNSPEVAIVGVNKLEVRPVWRNGAFEPRQVMNLSSSFDHRVVDGWDAATFVQRLKSVLETPALLFVD